VPFLGFDALKLNGVYGQTGALTYWRNIGKEMGSTFGALIPIASMLLAFAQRVCVLVQRAHSHKRPQLDEPDAAGAAHHYCHVHSELRLVANGIDGLAMVEVQTQQQRN
jgi:hypothetical protein